MSRDASTKITLSANGGYSLKNTGTSTINSVNAGVSAGYEGIDVSAGLSVPVSTATGASAPSVTVGLSYTPNTSKKNKINDQLTQISVVQEQMKVDAAYSDYETSVREMQLKLEDIKWDQETNAKNYEMYSDIENEMLNYYNRGIISEKEYASATINTLKSKVQSLINRIDLIVYNDEVKALFVE